MRYALTLALTLALCFTAQSLALRAVGGSAARSESNYFSSLGRLQAGARGKPEVMLLGSSITGRLPDRRQGFPGWANMGCDGGSAVDAMRAMDAGILPAAPWLVIEANTLHMPLVEGVQDLSGSLQGRWFKLGLHAPNFAAYARPAAFAYSKLHAMKFGQSPSANDEDLGVTSRPQMVSTAPGMKPTPEEEKLIEEMRGMLDRLKQRGSRAVIVWLPPARRGGDGLLVLTREMARRCEVPYWDLGQEAAPESVTLTDGVHMAPASAARTMRSLEKAVGIR